MMNVRAKTAPKKEAVGEHRRGFPTGAGAAAAAKAAAYAMIQERPVHEVEIALPSGRKVAFVIAGDKVKETAVTPGPRLGDWVEVSGLKPGDRVAVSGLDRLRDGARIKEVQK